MVFGLPASAPIDRVLSLGSARFQTPGRGPPATRFSSNGAVDVDVEAIGPMRDVADGARGILGGES